MKGLEGFLTILAGLTGIISVVWSMVANDLLPFIIWCGIVAIGSVILEETRVDNPEEDDA